MSLAFNSVLDFNDFNRGYAITLFSIWGLGVDIPRLMMRYGKAYPLVINIHSISMLMIGLITIMYVIAQIAMYQTEFGSTYAGLKGIALGQFVLSIIMACMVFIQFILGFLVRVEMFKSSFSSSFFLVKWVHKALGNLLIIIGKILATFIVNINTTQVVFRAWLFSLAGIAIIWIIFQVIYRSETRSVIYKCLFRHKNKHVKYHNQIYQKLIDRKQHFQTYKSKGVRYIIIDNTMYYIDEHFMHPGGEFIFNLINGKEINYYLKGAKSVTPDHPRHIHTKYVAKYLENRIVGELEVQPLLINQKLANQIADWKICSSLKTNFPGIHLITFETESGYVRQTFKVQNFGKYIMMGCSTEEVLNKTERPYYFCHSLSDYQRNTLQKYRRYYKYYYYNQNIDEDEGNKKKAVDNLSSKLTFFVKEYKHGLFTRFLLNAPKDRIFSITGPYGKGLHLKQKSSGYYMIIAAGIGIIPFADLFYYLLQKMLHDLIKLKASSPSLKKINDDGNHYQALSNIKILLVGSFTSPDKFYLNTPIKELYYLGKKHGIKNFNLMLRYQNTEVQQDIKMIKDNFNRDFFLTLMQEQQPDRVFYSGPGGLQKILRNVEPELKLKSSIQYM